MCDCHSFHMALNERRVLRNFSALAKAGEKVVDISWERGRQWRERALALFSGKNPKSFSIEAGRLDAEVLLLAGWAKEEFSLASKILQAPSFDVSVSKISAALESGEAWLKADEGGRAFEIAEGGRAFFAPKEDPSLGDLLARQMGLLPPDPLYGKSLSFEIEGAQDVG